jgi:hypothetical protein
MADKAPAPRSRTQRIMDTLARFTQETDCWIASATQTGDAYLVPLWFTWSGGRFILATPRATRTARSLQQAERTRLALGSPTDVVIVDGTVAVVESAAVAPALADAFAARTGWDPRQDATLVYIILTPQRIQVWRNESEIADRTIMANGQWL